jgi:hypothetical protein
LNEALGDGGDAILTTATTETEAVLGGLFSIVGKISADSKEGKISTLRSQNQSLEGRIISLKQRANSYVNR